MKRLLLSLTLTFFSTINAIFADDINVEYYGVVSNSTETNMTKMAQDIFFTQLKSISYISVEDKRPDLMHVSKEIPDFDSTQSSNIVFYAEINEEQNENQKVWNCSFNAMKNEDKIIHTKTEVYDSYYKILSNAKSIIEDVISDFRDKKEQAKNENIYEKPKTYSGNIDVESLAGTWYGEPYTDKIMILRGGRGFIIFKNGATMNIKISIKKSDSSGNIKEIEINQIGKSNASFYPELPRQTALNIAASATPISWTFKIDSGIMRGTKKTNAPTGANGVKEVLLETTWSKN